LNPETLSTATDLLYLLSLKITDGQSEKAIYKNIYNQEDIKGLDAY